MTVQPAGNNCLQKTRIIFHFINRLANVLRPEQPLISYPGTASFTLESLVQSDPAIDQLIR